MSELLNLPKTIVHEIVSEDLAMRKICTKFVPKNFDRRSKSELHGSVQGAETTLCG